MDRNPGVGTFLTLALLVVAGGVAVAALAGVLIEGLALLITVGAAEAESVSSQPVTQVARAAFAQAVDTQATKSNPTRTEQSTVEHHIEHHPHHARPRWREERYACWCCRPVWRIEYPRCRYGVGACGWGGRY